MPLTSMWPLLLCPTSPLPGPSLKTWTLLTYRSLRNYLWRITPGSDMFSFPYRVKAAQTELGQQILADFEEAFPSQGTKVLFCIFPLALDIITMPARFTLATVTLPLPFQKCWLAAMSLFAKGSGQWDPLWFSVPQSSVASSSVFSQRQKVRICFGLI